MSAAKHNDKDSFASFRARKGSLWVGSEPKDTVQEEDEDETKPEPVVVQKSSPAPAKSIIKIDKIREKFEVMKTGSPAPGSTCPARVSHVPRPDVEIETEESVSSKLEQWKRRRIERLER